MPGIEGGGGEGEEEKGQYISARYRGGGRAGEGEEEKGGY